MDPGADTTEAIVRYWPSLIGATFVALVHLLVPRFRLMRKPDNPWVPASAGVAIAYVFMDIFPHLAKSREKLGNVSDSGVYGFLTHVVGLDSLLREHFRNLYDRAARFVFAASVYAGWFTGVVVEISDTTLALWFSFLAGGIIVTATVYELPRIRSLSSTRSFVPELAGFPC